MSQVMAVFYGLIAIILIGASVAMSVVVSAETDAGDAEDEALAQLAYQTIWGIGGVLGAAYLATAIGVGRRTEWGRAMAFILAGPTMATVIFLPLAIASFFVLTKPEAVQ